MAILERITERRAQQAGKPLGFVDRIQTLA